MRKQPREILQTLFSSVTSRRDSQQGPVKAGTWWNKMPQFLNLARYTFQSLQQDNVLDYDPFYLHVTPAEVHPLVPKGNAPSRIEASVSCMMGQKIGLESFRFLLDQLPSVLSIEFSGQTRDPFENPELLQMVDAAFRFNGAESTIYTDGLLLGHYIDEIVKSRLHTVVINMVAHRPSTYGLMSGKPLSQFVSILKNVEALIERKKFYRSKMAVELRMSVDVHNFQDIPAMIQFAQDLGADGIHFENYVTPDGGEKSDRSLYGHNSHIVQYLKELSQLYKSDENFVIRMPRLLEYDMSEHRHCKDAFNTVSVDSEFNVSACSRHLLLYGPLGKIWDEDFFNNPMYQWLRNIYSTNIDPYFAPDVPLACQGCPRNLPCLDAKKTVGKS